MKIRGSLGTRRIEPQLEDDVCIQAIPDLSDRVHVFGLDEISEGGMAPKNVVRVDGNVRYIAKRKSKKNSSEVECITEYLISQIGRLLPLSVAEGRIARFPVKPGEPRQVHFMSRVFINDPTREHLLHGVQLAAICFDIEHEEIVKEIPPLSHAERSFYTIEMIDDLLRHVSNSNDNHRELRNSFARMMAFDALIGANDRHSENWGLIIDPTKGHPPRWAPLYDTARGLFWQWTDMKLEAKDLENDRAGSIERYAMGSEPLISADRLHGKPDHFEVIAAMVDRFPGRFGSAVRSVVEGFRCDEIAGLLHREFKSLLSRRRLEYIDGLLRFRHRNLRKACRLSM